MTNGEILYGSFQPIWLKDDDNENQKIVRTTVVFLRQGKKCVVTFQFEGEEQFATNE